MPSTSLMRGSFPLVLILLLIAPPAVAESHIGADLVAEDCAGPNSAAGAYVVADEENNLDMAPALGLVQRALWSKRREARLGEIAQNASRPSRPSPHNFDKQAFHDAIQPCLYGADLSDELPFAVNQRMELETFRELGFVNKAALGNLVCKQQKYELAFLSYVLPENASVEHKNKIAKVVVVVWALFAFTLVAWNLLSVALVRRKPDIVNKEESAKLNLADEESAWKKGFIAWASIGWADDLMGRYGKCLHSVIEDSEICGTIRQDRSFTPHVVFKKYWESQIKDRGMQNASLIRSLYNTVGFKASFSLVLSVVLELFLSQIGMVLALDKFLGMMEHMSEQQEADPEAELSMLEPTIMIVLLIWGVPMLFRAASIIVSLLDGYYTNVCAGGLAAIVFEKALSSPAGAAPPTQTKVNEDSAFGVENTDPNLVQLLNVDIVQCWGYLLKTVVYSACAPLFTIALFVMLIMKIHMAGVVGFLYVIPCMAFTLVGGGLTIQAWIKYQNFLDKRMKYLTETMINVRTIKSLAWESLSFGKLKAARDAELSQWFNVSMFGAFVGAIGLTLPWGSILVSLLWSLKTKGFIVAHEIIVIQRIMGSMLASIGIITNGMTKMLTAPNNFRRIKQFLAEGERPVHVVKPPSLTGPSAPAVRVHGSFSFLAGKDPAIRDLDVAIPKGEFVGIIGGVASGKSAFLQTLIGELYPIGRVGEAYVEAPDCSKGEIAYCSQVPWIFEGTLQENVILDKVLEPERYYKALHCAALTSDLQILPGADMVTIGSYGIRLSGGQRARVSLARAAYMKNEVVILDDPFASVDVPTGQHLLTELICGPLMSDRTRIVVMQPNAHRLSKCDRVLLFENGEIVVSGTPAEVMEHAAFGRLLATASENGHAAENAETNDQHAPTTETVQQVCQKALACDEANELREVEAQDHITTASILWWLKAAGYVNLLGFCGMMLCGRLVGVFEQALLARWINSKLLGPVNDYHYMGTIVMVVCAYSVMMVLGVYAAMRLNITGAKALHETVMSSILSAPIDKFFDKQPVGRLINRLSHDMRWVDEGVVEIMRTLVSFFAGFIVTNSFILNVMPTEIVIASVPMFGITIWFIYIFRGATVPLVFHSKFSLSSMQDLQSVVLSTCVPIRANGMLNDFMARFSHYTQSVIRSQYLIYHVCKTWVQGRVFLSFGCLTGMFAMGGLWSNVPMGTLSVVITMSFAQMQEFEDISLMFTQTINILNALQRLTKYFDIPQEAPHEMPGDPTIRFRAKLDRGDLASIGLRRGKDAEACLPPCKDDCPQLALCVNGNMPVLRASADGMLLELLPGRLLRDLAPGCEALRHLKECYSIVAVNNVTRNAEEMAEELCHPSASIWLDLWHKDFAMGLRVQLEDLTAGYNNDKNILNHIDIDLAPRMKVGIAGKTGCGKSTTLLCMLRILEARGGKIKLGDIDISTMGLRTLRSTIGLVPQDPTVFEGTWRYNIDPFDEYPDGRIWDALRCVQLLPYVRQLPEGIKADIQRDGANLSFGQRQLLSMARMVIRQPPVLLLDECTSALDPATQEVVQKTVLHEFPLTTVIAIAHRVETILDFDRIVVLDKGQVAEVGTVAEVMKLGGIFAGMVNCVKNGRT